MNDAFQFSTCENSGLLSTQDCAGPLPDGGGARQVTQPRLAAIFSISDSRWINAIILIFSGHLRILQIEHLERRQTFQLRHSCICHLGPP